MACLSFFRWLGIHDISNEGTFVYDSTGEPIGFTDWTNGEPNNDGGEGDCVVHWQHWANEDVLGWNDRSCDYRTPVVCEAHELANFNLVEEITIKQMTSANDLVFKIGGIVYSYSSKKASFVSAQQHCAKYGGKLFEPKSKATYTEVEKKLQALGLERW